MHWHAQPLRRTRNMTDERQSLNRAAKAQEALENPLIAEALTAWELEITEAWKTSPLRDAEGREKLRLLLEAAQAFRLHLTNVMETGKLLKAPLPQPSIWHRARQTLSGGHR